MARILAARTREPWLDSRALYWFTSRTLFRIRRIQDDVLEVNRRALQRVQALMHEQFPSVPLEKIAELTLQLRDPVARRLRTVVLVAERRQQIAGYAIVMHAPDLDFCFLDFIASAPGEAGRGIGGALYERVRDECRLLGATGLLFECLPDDIDGLENPEKLRENAERLRFYERYGARPIANTAYQLPVTPTDTDMPLLVFDDLDSGVPLRKRQARAYVRAVLERRYNWLCPPEYVQKVVSSIQDDPVKLRPPRYVKKKLPTTLSAARVPYDARFLLVVNDKHDIHHVRERGYVEAPVRVGTIRRELEKLDIFHTVPPTRFADAHVTAVHDLRFVRYLKRMCGALPPGESVYPYVFPIRNPSEPPRDLPIRAGYYCIDTFTPLNQNAWPAARRAADCALTGASALLAGRLVAYALVRPPGHHAEHKTFGGFCYLNNAAIAAQLLSKHGRVAMLDVDYHHGNGQQEIFFSRKDVLTVSIHGHPRFAYPYFSGFPREVGQGEGEGYNLNIALPERTDGKTYARALERALVAVRSFAPRFLVVCLGLDTAKGDPTGSWSLGAADFEHNGSVIGALGVPTLVVQEGGYNTRNLGVNARYFFRGMWQASLRGAKLTERRARRGS